MPSLVVGNTEQAGGKLKNWKGFSKPNFEPGPNCSGWLSGCFPVEKVIHHALD
jgi:hypothetical protein